MCKIAGQWGALCKARRLAPKNPLKLCVTQESDNRVVYLRYALIGCQHRETINPLNTVVCLHSPDAGFLRSGLN